MISRHHNGALFDCLCSSRSAGVLCEQCCAIWSFESYFQRWVVAVAQPRLYTTQDWANALVLSLVVFSYAIACSKLWKMLTRSELRVIITVYFCLWNKTSITKLCVDDMSSCMCMCHGVSHVSVRVQCKLCSECCVNFSHYLVRGMCWANFHIF